MFNGGTNVAAVGGATLIEGLIPVLRNVRRGRKLGASRLGSSGTIALNI